MQWFIIQHVSAAVTGGTVADYVGPFYGNPMSIEPLMRSGDYILVYANGAWTEYVNPAPIVGR